jgi:hypothetical protein
VFAALCSLDFEKIRVAGLSKRNEGARFRSALAWEPFPAGGMTNF